MVIASPEAIKSRRDYISHIDTQMKQLQDLYENSLADWQISLKEKTLKASEGREYLAPIGRKCEAITLIEAELLSAAPELGSDGKRLTVEVRAAWVENAKRKYQGYKDAISKQNTLQVQLDDYDVQIGALERQMTFVRLQMEYLTAALKFMAG